MLKIKEVKALARENLIGRYGTVIGAYFLSLFINFLFIALCLGCIAFICCSSGIAARLLGVTAVFSFTKVLCGIIALLFLIVCAVIVWLWLEIGRKKLLLNICRGRKYSVSDIFYAFQTGSHPWRYILAGVLLAVILMCINAIPAIVAFINALAGSSDSTGAATTLIVIRICAGLLSLFVSVTFMFVKVILLDKPETDLLEAFSKSHELMHGRHLKGIWLIVFSFLFWNMLMGVCQLSALWILPYIEVSKIIFYMDADGSTWQLPGAKKKKSEEGCCRPAAAAPSVINPDTVVNAEENAEGKTETAAQAGIEADTKASPEADTEIKSNAAADEDAAEDTAPSIDNNISTTDNTQTGE